MIYYTSKKTGDFMNFLQPLKKYEQELIEDLRGLLACKSVLEENPDDPEAPFGIGLRQSLDYVLKLGARYGFETLNVDTSPLSSTAKGEIIGVLCQWTWCTRRKWDYPPFMERCNQPDLLPRRRRQADDSSLYALRLLRTNRS